MVVPCTAGMASHPKTPNPTDLHFSPRPPLPSSRSRPAHRLFLSPPLSRPFSLVRSASAFLPPCLSPSCPWRAQRFDFFFSGRSRSPSSSGGWREEILICCRSGEGRTGGGRWLRRSRSRRSSRRRRAPRALCPPAASAPPAPLATTSRKEVGAAPNP
jgi:hypothetical protein